MHLSLDTSEPKKITIHCVRVTYMTVVSGCYFVSILTKVVFPRQSSLAVPTNDVTKILQVDVDVQTDRLAQGTYILVAFRNFYSSSKM